MMLSVRSPTALRVKAWGIRQFLFLLSNRGSATTHHITFGWRATIPRDLITLKDADITTPFCSANRRTYGKN